MPKDNFSKQSATYAQFRPHYPDELYHFIYDHTHAFHTAWDCATGNGQVARVLCEQFDQVFATDISLNQMAQAVQAPNITYQKGSAEHSGLPANEVDLVTVAQAIHWFNLRDFYKEVKRVARPTGALAYWGYYLPKISEKIDPLLWHFHDHKLGPYWDPERKIWASKYNLIDLPLKNRKEKNFEYVAKWNLSHFQGYLTSWSAVQHFITTNKYNPVDEFIKTLRPLWQQKKQVRFPIFLTLGQIS
ncbi:MAG: class I SAM-dependent methyltransferase [Fulvivirga sp.]|nr:class I SAM-dependent methyltransferase [Fulvivirga sp.]